MPRQHIFISYSHKDLEWRDSLEEHLKPFLSDPQNMVWSDEQIAAGRNWNEDIDSALSEAKIAVLLVSAHFLASSYICEKELPYVLAAAKEGSLTLIWIAVRASSYDQTGLAAFQAANKPEKPLNSLSPADQDRELVRIAHEIAMASRSDTATEVPQVSERAPELSQPKPVHISYLLYGCAGGTIAGIYIWLAYYFSQHKDFTTQQSWWWQLSFLVLVFFSVAIASLGSASIHYFIWKFQERRNNAGRIFGLLYDLVAGGLGGAITSVGAGLLAAITFGQLNAPPISPAHVLLGVGIGMVLINMSVLKSVGAEPPLSLASSFCAAVLVFSLLIALILRPSFDNGLRDYFDVSKLIFMLGKAISVGLAAGILIGLQIAISRLLLDVFLAAGRYRG